MFIFDFMIKVDYLAIFILTLMTSINVNAIESLFKNLPRQPINYAVATAEIKGRVYQDTNANGNQDSGEPGLADVNVIVVIDNDSGTTIKTDENGDWSLNVDPGNSTLIFIDESSLPPGSFQTEGINPNPIDVIDNQSNDGGTYGYALGGELNGQLYYDVDGSGTQDATEDGISNVDIQIEDAFGNSQTIETDANGDWSIQVPEGNVTSTIDTTDVDFPTGATQTEGTNPTTKTIEIDKTSNEVDDGFFESGQLSGRLYSDINGNGKQDAGESGIANVDVQIDDALGNSQTIETNANGDWSIQVPIGDVTSTIDTSDPDFPTGATQTEGNNPTTTTITNGDIFSEVDGFFESGQLSGRLYFDTDENGTQNTGEPGIANVEVKIENTSANFQKSIETDANGDWSIEVPIGKVKSTIDENDSDFPVSAKQTEGENPTTTDIENNKTYNETDGFFGSGQLSGRLYFDTDESGVQDTGEPGIANVDIQVDDVLGNSQTIVTDANGEWSIEVPVGDVTSTIDTNDPDFPTGATQTEGTNPTETMIVIDETSNEADGFFGSAKLSGRLYFDTDESGTQDTGEPGIANVEVKIENALVNFQKTIETDVNGDWSIQAPVGKVTSTVDENDPDFPTGANQTQGENPTTTDIQENGETYNETDGFFGSGQLSGQLYLDTNGNATKDTGEAGIADVDIQIKNALGNTQIIETDANGEWSIEVLIGNVTSTIDENDPDLPTGATQTEGTNPTSTTITNDNTFDEIDGFFVPDSDETGVLTGHLYLDEDGDGTQNPSEANLPNIDIEITDSQNNTQTVSTDVNGDWSVNLPTGNAISDIDNADPDLPSGVIQIEGTDPTTTLVVPNVTTFSENDGFFVSDPNETGTLTGHLYLDENGDQTQNPNEGDLADIDIEITDNQNNTQIISTDANGDWSVTLPTGNAISDIDNADPDFPVGAIQTEGSDPTTTLVTPDVTIFSENDGFFVPDSNETGTLTGHLYLDENGDGSQDPGEANLKNIDIEITDSENNIQIISTDANGDWSVTIPTGNANSDIDETDMDFPANAVQTEGTDPTTTLVTPNTTTFSDNDGFFVPNPEETGTLTGHLYLDANGDSTQNPSEADLSNIDIEITDNQDNSQIISTDANGDWSVTLPTGDATSDIDQTDQDIPAAAIQTEGTDPTTTLVTPNVTTFSENDGFFVDTDIFGTLAGRLYLDENGNGTQDLNEPGIESVSVEIEDKEGNIETVETDFDGNWSVDIQAGEVISLIDEADRDFPENSQQIQGSNPTLSQVTADETTNEIDGYYTPQEIKVFNAISPNGDGQNDFLRIEGLNPSTSNSIKIFNRSGVKVYEVKNYGNDGYVFKGVSEGRITIRKGKKLPSGTYFYILRYEDINGSTFKKQGYLYIN